MAIKFINTDETELSDEDESRTAEITRGVRRLFLDLGFAPLCELTLITGRRVDVAGLNKKGELIVAEVKSSIPDFRSDQKWTEYLDHCDRFFFAVNRDFPTEIIPEEVGLIIADGYGGTIVRESPTLKLAPARRKNLTLKFARVAAERLTGYMDES
jgi:hypothetical protein